MSKTRKLRHQRNQMAAMQAEIEKLRYEVVALDGDLRQARGEIGDMGGRIRLYRQNADWAVAKVDELDQLMSRIAYYIHRTTGGRECRGAILPTLLRMAGNVLRDGGEDPIAQMEVSEDFRHLVYEAVRMAPMPPTATRPVGVDLTRFSTIPHHELYRFFTTVAAEEDMMQGKKGLLYKVIWKDRKQCYYLDEEAMASLPPSVLLPNIMGDMVTHLQNHVMGNRQL